MLGKKFGKLTVLREAQPNEKKSWQRKYKTYVCQCDCGNETTATGVELRAGNKSSCGCGKRHAHKRDTLHAFVSMLFAELPEAYFQRQLNNYALFKRAFENIGEKP